MIKKVAKGVYPCFESELKCIKTLVNFKKGEFYKIEGFGNSKGADEVKFAVWFMVDLSNPHIKFPVKKETINTMIDKGMLIHHYNKN